MKNDPISAPPVGIEPRYVIGMGRNDGEEKQCSHLYVTTTGSDRDLLPMCRKGWNRSDGESFSIFRGHTGSRGICKTCQKRREQGLPGVDAVPGSHKTRWI